MTEKKKHPGGRPEKIDLEKVTKLEQAFAIDCTVEEACSYAEVSRKVYYEYIKRHPEFGDRIEELRQKPILKARQTIVKNLDNPQHAQWYLSRKKKLEFAERYEADITSNGEQIMTGESEIAALAKQAAEMLKKNDTDSTTTSSA